MQLLTRHKFCVQYINTESISRQIFDMTLPTDIQTTKKEKNERKWKSTSLKLKDTIMKVKTIWKFSKLRLMRYNRWSTQILQIMYDLAFYDYN